jgi:ATP-dependent DNA helicase DinG
MTVEERFSPQVLADIRRSIREASGNEVLVIGRLDSEGRVAESGVAARGDAQAVPALKPYLEKGDVVIHNHPSGLLGPSAADLGVASQLGAQGVGFYIVDNPVERVYVVAEPVLLKRIEPLEEAELARHLQSGGSLSRLYPGFEERACQVKMLRFVAGGFNRDEILAAEAGTGVGKSLAYLLPAFQWVLDNEERVVVSTATINLQQQLVDKDIPLVIRMLGKDPGAYLVKGRGNYLCRTRLLEAQEEASLFEEPEGGLAAIRRWAEATTTGSRSDLPDYPSDELWSRVCSEADACHGLRCPHREGCFVLKARREAAAARVLVANHHLLFSDLAMRVSGTGYDVAAVLPPFQRIIFDEAHNIERSATSYFSVQFSRLQVAKIASRLYKEKKRKRHGLILGLERLLEGRGRLAEVRRTIAAVLACSESLDASALALMQGQPALRLPPGLQGGGAEEKLASSLAELIRSIGLLGVQLERLFDELEGEEGTPESYFVFECRIQLRRLQSVAETAQRFLRSQEHPADVFWLEARKDHLGEPYVRFTITPLAIAPMMAEAVYRPYRSVLFTSATLTVGGDFDYWKSRVGLSQLRFRECREAAFPSPFDYESNVLLGVPTEAPEPEQEGYRGFVARYLGQALAISGGRALVLFTSYALLQETFQAIGPELAQAGIPLMRQGDEDRGRLLKRFREDAASVLLATDSFWEGIDAPGETLELVVLTRLPFRVPSDPVLQARMDSLKAEGRNPFYELSLPDAVVRLRQGFGRLMRRQDDRGAVLILDSRVVRRPYGRVFLESLPHCRQVLAPGPRLLAELAEFFGLWHKKKDASL